MHSLSVRCSAVNKGAAEENWKLPLHARQTNGGEHKDESEDENIDQGDE